jgi:hypothetical protein
VERLESQVAVIGDRASDHRKGMVSSSRSF